MIAVIADDLTGAVEIAGVGLRYGLKVEIVATSIESVNADVLVVATDTRSMSESEAVNIMADITARLKTLNSDFIFKKVDSVLRGHVIAELHAHLDQLQFEKALLVPANPSLGRIITNGWYFVNEQPIHLSSFASDPDFAITASDIPTMLRCDKNEIAVKTTIDTLPSTGITVGECVSETDLKKWAKKIDSQTLLAGGSSFFAAILESLGYLPQTDGPNVQFEKNALFVSGTTFDKSRQLVKHLKHADGPVSYMPQRIINSADLAENLFDDWSDEVTALLNLHNKAVIAVEDNASNAVNLREKKAVLVKKVFQKVLVKELLIEGGATASAIIKRLNLSRFTPVHEFSTGVVRMEAIERPGLFLTMKPGSYSWPAQVWDM